MKTENACGVTSEKGDFCSLLHEEILILNRENGKVYLKDITGDRMKMLVYERLFHLIILGVNSLAIKVENVQQLRSA